MKHSRLILVASIIITLILWLLAQTPLIGYFDSNIEQQRVWYPHFYWLSFFIFKCLFAFASGMWLGMLLRKYFQRPLLSISVALMWMVLLVFLNLFYPVRQVFSVVFVLASLHIVLHFYLQVKDLVLKVFSSYLIQRTGIFVAVILLSLLLPKVHPFSKYAMFNSFRKQMHAYDVRDAAGKIIPLAKVSSINGNELYEIHQALLAKYGFDDEPSGADTIQLQQIGKEMHDIVAAAIYDKKSIGSFSINRITFQLEGDTIVSTEQTMWGAIFN